jgi:drug/metabolite transporter (DMT)-like permease
MFDLTKKRWQWVSMLLLAMVWGSSFILMKKGLMAFTYIQVAAFRIAFAFIILIPLIVKHFKLLTKENFWSIALVGFAGIFFPAFLFSLAQTSISSSLAGILNSASPLFALIVGIIFYHNRPLKTQTLGIVIGFIGAAMLILNGQFDSLRGINIYGLFVVLATFGYGINANEVRFRLHYLNGIQITTLSFLLIGPPAIFVLLSTNLSEAYNSEFFLGSLFAVMALSAFGSVVSLFVYNNLIHRTSALFATSVTYIIPIFAILWGIFDGELINPIQYIGMGVVLLGVYLVNRKNRTLQSQIENKFGFRVKKNEELNRL